MASAIAVSSTDTRRTIAYDRALRHMAASLVPSLVRANTESYLRRMREYAVSLDARMPTRITDPVVLAGINARAHVSAMSIARTQAQRMQVLVQRHGSFTNARDAFAQWHEQQRQLISRYETAMTVHQAQRDFVLHNQLTGFESVVPLDATCSTCRYAVARGKVPVGTLQDFPLHINCRHTLLMELDMPQDTGNIWLG